MRTRQKPPEMSTSAGPRALDAGLLPRASRRRRVGSHALKDALIALGSGADPRGSRPSTPITWGLGRVGEGKDSLRVQGGGARPESNASRATCAPDGASIQVLDGRLRRRRRLLPSAPACSRRVRGAEHSDSACRAPCAGRHADRESGSNISLGGAEREGRWIGKSATWESCARDPCPTPQGCARGYACRAGQVRATSVETDELRRAGLSGE